MRAPARRRLLGAALALGLLGAGWTLLARELEGLVNRVEPVSLPNVSPRARALHARSLVADLHADSLLFERDLLERGRHGHVDLPRLREGGVGLQVFAVPTIVPLGANIDRTERGRLDLIGLAGVVQLSPMAWRGATGRALQRARELRRTVERAEGNLLWIDDRGDVARLLETRENGDGPIGVLLAIEGGHAMESDPGGVQTLFDAGYRMIGLAHFFDNDYAGSAHGVERGGLTPLGRRTIQEMEARGIVVDLAHLSPRAMDETLAIATRPTVFSHGGVRGTCDNARNLDDAQIRRIAAGGGVIGIGYWDIAVCGRSPEDIARAIAYVAALVGSDHVALGSDYDGATTVGFDTSALPAITEALLDVGLSERDVRRVLGGNVLRLLSQVLPAAAGASSASS
jgi:microsomal dipeptidase-like Zn-dependent dipeptidase